MHPLLPLEAMSRMNFVLLMVILANIVTRLLFCAPEALISFRCTGGGKHSYAYVRKNILRHTPNHVTTRTSFAPSHYEYVFRLRIITRMRKQWKPGPFLLPLSGLGTRLSTDQLFKLKTTSYLFSAASALHVQELTIVSWIAYQ